MIIRILSSIIALMNEKRGMPNMNISDLNSQPNKAKKAKNIEKSIAETENTLKLWPINISFPQKGFILGGVIFFVVILGIGTSIVSTRNITKQFDDLKSIIREDTNEGSAGSYININGKTIQEKYADIYRENTDFVGWLTIEGTSIDYPVLKSSGNEYAGLDFSKKKNKQGSIYVDEYSDILTPSDNIFVNGIDAHNGTMFGGLDNYKNKSFYENHKIIEFNTIHRDSRYEIIAAFPVKISEDSSGFHYEKFYSSMGDADSFENYIDNITKLSLYETDSTAFFGDDLITLSSTSYQSKNGRFVVVARKIY